MAPTGATSPAGTRISASTPAVVDGTSIDTLSVSISNRLSPGSTASPADLNHFVILPSATVSPSCGINTSMRAPSTWTPRSPSVRHVPRNAHHVITAGQSTTSLASPDPFPHHFVARARRPQDQAIARKLVTPNKIGDIARLNAGVAVVRDRAGALVDRVGAEIGDVVQRAPPAPLRAWPRCPPCRAPCRARPAPPCGRSDRSR